MLISGEARASGGERRIANPPDAIVVFFMCKTLKQSPAGRKLEGGAFQSGFIISEAQAQP
jgi:hypothetical protein